jgi:hypothetical protein
MSNRHSPYYSGDESLDRLMPYDYQHTTWVCSHTGTIIETGTARVYCKNCHACGYRKWGLDGKQFVEWEEVK